MKRLVENTIYRSREKLRDKRGMMMAELLIVVAILAILAGISFVGVSSYQRSMGQLERDGIAKQIFVAAQNHLTAAKGEGYLGKQGAAFGTKEDGEIYYIVHNRGDTIQSDSVLDDILPFGSIDETIRTGGNYVIRYYRDAGVVKDVFYCSDTGSPSQFNHRFFEGGDSYNHVISMADPAKKSARQTYVNNSILGWYGGAEAETLNYIELKLPEVEVVNAERLYVRIKDPNLTYSAVTQDELVLRLLVSGVSSKKQHYVNIDRLGKTDDDGWLIVVLDDITEESLHFCKRVFDDMEAQTSNGFIPGENISVQAVVDGKVNISSSNVYIPAKSVRKTTNSLFAGITDSNNDKKFDTANIANIRHLENLNKSVSNWGDGETIAFTSAIQMYNLSANQSVNGKTADLSWNGFKAAIKSSAPESVTVVRADGKATGGGKFLPVDLGTITSYDGRSHSITGIDADGKLDGQTALTNVGLFGTLDGQTVSGLSLIDFTISGTANAGALAGSAANTVITNVVARNSGSGTAPTVTSGGSAGGLIGSMSGGSVSYCAAALTVESGANAGGLIGTADSVTVTGCYAGGHTDQGEYYQHDSSGKRTTPIYNVTASDNAGGLIGEAAGATVTNSYSTCSVSGTAAAGGFVGTASGTIADCYCTGLVSGATEGAFAGSLSGSASVSGCQYFAIINEREDAAGGFTCLEAADNAEHSGITALDESAASYDSFVGETGTWDAADAYDPVLRDYYRNNSYPLRTVFQLPTKSKTTGQTAFAATHYGDWPAPEIFLINK